MPSEHRLHPYSILFAFLTQIRLIVVPGLFVVIGTSSRGGEWWQPWMMLLIIPNALVSVLRYVTFRYHYADSELVIRSGLIFRKERHIPYARIQNIDAVQNVLHRLLDVVEVKLETGGGDTAEATMSVLPAAAFHDMRARVFGERQVQHDVAALTVDGETALLRLGVRELLLYGFIESRGAVVVGAAFGVLFEFGLLDRLVPALFGEQFSGRGAMRNLMRDLVSNVTISASRVAITLAAFALLFLGVRVLSMGWAAIRLHGFKLALVDGDARTEYGLLTRIAATIPLRRIQTLSIRESPLHRLFKRVAVKADTAGGRGEQGRERGSEREWLAPILKRDALPSFVAALVAQPYDGVDWQRVAPGAFRREVKGWLATAALLSGGLWLSMSWYAVPVLPLLILWALVCAHRTVTHLGWAMTDEAVFVKRGWLWRRVNIVRFAKIQTVTLHESPFDRRTVMAGVHVDTAAASEGSVLHIPYLSRETAAVLYNRLAAEAARRQFKW